MESATMAECMSSMEMALTKLDLAEEPYAFATDKDRCTRPIPSLIFRHPRLAIGSESNQNQISAMAGPGRWRDRRKRTDKTNGRSPNAGGGALGHFQMTPGDGAGGAPTVVARQNLRKPIARSELTGNDMGKLVRVPNRRSQNGNTRSRDTHKFARRSPRPIATKSRL